MVSEESRGCFHRPRSAAASCAAATGFTLIALEIFLLLAFQSIYGYVYHQLAILIGLSMAGIALGSWLALRRIRLHPGPPHLTMAITQLLLALACPALLLAVSLLQNFTGSATTWLAAQLVLPSLAALSGILGGYQFPIAAEIYLHDRAVRSGLRYALCPRSARRMRRRAPAEHLSTSRFRLLENRLALRSHQPGACTACGENGAGALRKPGVTRNRNVEYTVE